MANVSLKTDFKNGDKLYDSDLNNNFKAIQAALAMMNAIIWQDNADKMVTFRGTTQELAEREVINGQVLYNTETGESYIDYNNKRISTGSGNVVHVGPDEPENEATQLWIEDDLLDNIGTEIESGSNENGNWIKFSNGTMICTKYVSAENIDIKTAYGNIFSSVQSAIDLGNFPLPFHNTAPYVSYQFIGANSQWILGVGTQATTTHAGKLTIGSAVDKTVNSYWNVIAIGRWK